MRVGLCAGLVEAGRGRRSLIFSEAAPCIPPSVLGEGPRPAYLHLRGVDLSKQPWGGPWPCQRGQAHDPYLVPHSGGAEAAGLRLQVAAVKGTVDRSYDIAFGTHCLTRLRPPGLGTTRISTRPPRASDERGPRARRDLALAECAAQASPSVGQDLYPQALSGPGARPPREHTHSTG